MAPSLTTKQLRDLYIEKKRADVVAGEYSGRSLISTVAALEHFVNRIGGPIDQLTNKQFADYRHRLAKKYQVTSLDRFVTQARAMFSWAVRNHYIARLPPWGDSFNKVSDKQFRAAKQEAERKLGPKVFSREEIQAMMAYSSPILQAMILLGLNCALGNGDIAELTTDDFDLDAGILDYPRRKNHTPRRATLWPETVDALRLAIPLRADAAKKVHARHVFLTTRGHPICRLTQKPGEDKIGTETKIDGLSAVFYKLMKRSEVKLVQGRNYYALRHTFRTVARKLTETAAIDLIMGHASTGIASTTYIHHGVDPEELDRCLKVVTDYVRNWYYGPPAAPVPIPAASPVPSHEVIVASDL